MKIFLATCENYHHYQCATAAGAKNILMSYYHANLKSEKMAKMFSSINAMDQELICDSGLFTMMFGAGKGKTYTKSDILQYTKDYILAAHKFGVKKATFVEMDTHKILPLADLFEIRKMFEDSGLKVMYAWHKEEGIDGLYAMAEKYDYIALSIPELRILCKGKKIRYQDMTKDLLYKIKKNVKKFPKIHLLGNTVMETMDTSLAYSCDSSSWTYGVRHARMTFFHNNTICQKYFGKDTPKEWRDRFDAQMNKIKSRNPEVLDLLKDANATKTEYILNLVFSATSYQLYQDYLNLRRPSGVLHES